MTEDKKLTNDIKDEALNEDKLDNVAGGAILVDQIVRQSEQAKHFELLAQRDHTGGEDF